MLRSVCKVLIGAQQDKLVADAEMRDERVDRPDLHAGPSARVSDACRANMVFAVWLDQCERREPLDDLRACLGARKALEQLLQDEACCHDDVGSGKRFLECLHLRFFNLDIASEGERPDARIDEERHLRERSAL